MYNVFKKIESEEQVDIVLILHKTNHDTDLRRFTDKNGHFKSYVKMVAIFDSRVHFPGDKPSRFMISKHTWYALRIIKNNELYNFKMSDIFHLN